MKVIPFPAAIALLLLVATAVHADESLVPTAESGGWIALEHRQNMTDRPDVCLALNQPTGVGFRSDGTTVQIRVMNKSWSLPLGIKGTLIVFVNDSPQRFDIDDNTSDMVNADMSGGEASALFMKMDRASTMRVVAGKAQPIEVSLSGSSRVTNAFRTCAGVEGNATSTGSNPFQ